MRSPVLFRPSRTSSIVSKALHLLLLKAPAPHRDSPLKLSFAAAPQVGCLWLNAHLITVSLSGAINYLDTAHPQQPARVISGHAKYVTALAVVPATHGLAREAFSGSYDASVQRWDLERGGLGKIQGKGG